MRHLSNPPNRLVAVHVATGHLEAEIVRGRLQAENIPAMLSYEPVGLVFGLTADGLGEVRVMVPAALEARARAVLKAPPERDDEAET